MFDEAMNEWVDYIRNNQDSNRQAMFIDGYNLAKSKYAQSDIIRFYHGEKVENCNFTVSEILDFTHSDLENCGNGVIQWMFPNARPSDFNEKAPLLSQSDIEYFRNNKATHFTVNLFVDQFLYHIGFTKGDMYDGFDTDYHLTYPNYLRKFNHNHMRITRMLIFLKAINHHMLDEAFNLVITSCPIEDSKKYWYEAYNG